MEPFTMTMLASLLGGASGAGAAGAGAGAIGGAAAGGAAGAGGLKLGANLLTKGAAQLPQMIKLISAIRQGQKAKGLAGQKRPEYTVPGSVSEATGNARMSYYDNRLPGQDYITGQLGASTASMIRAAKEAGRTPAEIVAAASAANDNQNDALVKLATESSNRTLQEQQQLGSQLNLQGQYEEKAFNYNKADPYKSAMEAKSALHQASAHNLYQGVSGAVATGLTKTGEQPKAGLLNDDFYKATLDRLLGNNSATAVPSASHTSVAPTDLPGKLGSTMGDKEWNEMLYLMKQGNYLKRQKSLI